MMHISSNRAVARISLSNIVHNINEFKKIKSEITKVCAVVKADAYGHGSVEVSNFIEKHIDDVECDILRPAGIEGQKKVAIKEYVDVNSAIALACEALRI